MSLRLVYGRIGSGKTSYCIAEAAEIKGRTILLVPEQFTFTAERRICERLGVHGLGGMEVLSFKRLATSVLSTAEGAALRRIDGASKAILIQKILVDNQTRLTAMKSAATVRGAAGELGKLFSEFKRYAITPEQLRTASETLPHIKEKLNDLALLFAAYDSTVKTRFFDMDDDIIRLAHALRSTRALENTAVYIDRFDGFTPAERQCILAMLETAPRVTVTLCLTPADRGKSEFMLHARMADKLTAMAKDAGITVEPPVNLGESRKFAQQEELAFLEREYFAYPPRVYPEPTTAITIFTAATPLSEVHSVARTILRLCRERGWLFRDIAVTARNTDMYERYIKAVFATYDIPYFMDRKTNILNHPVTVFMLTAIELILQGYSYEVVFRYVKSGFLRIPQRDVDVLENYVLATGVRGNIWKDDERWSVRAQLYLSRKDADAVEMAELARADKTRRLVAAPLIRLEEALKTGKSAAEKCAALYKFVEELKIERRISAIAKLFEKQGNLAAAAEYKGVYNDFIDALDGVYDAFGEEKIGVQRFYDVLRVGLGEYETGIIPSALDGVSVGSIDRIKGYDVKALFVVGTLDGVFPAAPAQGGILNEEDRNAMCRAGIEITSSDGISAEEEMHLIYKCLTIPRTCITLSMPAADMDGKALRPSAIVHRIRTIFPAVHEEDDLVSLRDADKLSVPDVTLGHVLKDLHAGNASDLVRSAYGWLQSHMPEKIERAMTAMGYENRTETLLPETMRHFIGKELTSSVSRLETFAACPFSYFAQYTLGARERRVLQPTAADAGSFLHTFIDTFSKRLAQAGKHWRDVDEAYADSEIDTISTLMDERLNSYVLGNSARYTQLFARLRVTVRRSVMTIAEHMRRGEFEPLGYELSFGDNGNFKPLTVTLPGGGKVKLTGRIDRADVWNDVAQNETFVRIIDYKSGSKEFNLDDVYTGMNLQLAVYMTALCENGDTGAKMRPAAMLYFRLNDPVVDGTPHEDDATIKKAKLKALKLSGLVCSDERILSRMDSDMNGYSDILQVRRTKDGYAGGDLATSAQFELLTKHVTNAVRRLCTSLAEGNTDIHPYQKGDSTPCTYCKYKAMCAHDGKTFRQFENRKPEEIWKEMEGAVHDAVDE